MLLKLLFLRPSALPVSGGLFGTGDEGRQWLQTGILRASERGEKRCFPPSACTAVPGKSDDWLLPPLWPAVGRGGGQLPGTAERTAVEIDLGRTMSNTNHLCPLHLARLSLLS